MKKYYTEKYFAERDVLSVTLAQELVFILIKNKAKKILDVGAGTGKLVKFLNYKGFEAIGVDSAKIAVKEYGVELAKADNLPFPNRSFDALTAISLIEHLTKTEAKKFLNEAYRVLRPDGLIFIVTPNYASPSRFIFGKKWFGFADPTHKTFFTPWSLKKLLIKFNFQKVAWVLPAAPNLYFDFDGKNFFSKLPRFLTNFLSFLLISTHFSLLRDSFWMIAKKNG